MNDPATLVSRLDVCAVVITYEPNAGLSERLDRIRRQVGRLIVVDNHSSKECLAHIRDLAARIGFDLVANDDNLGIATALNQGIRRAAAEGYRWVVTLDQDTVVFPTMVENLLAAYSGCTFREVVGIIGSNLEERGTGSVRSTPPNQCVEASMEANEVITSGSLMPLTVFENVGPFRDQLFIDLVDFEYCLRLRAAGYKVLMTTQVNMAQPFGNCKTKTVLGFTKIVRDYSPQRNYYRTRNGLLLVREYLWREPAWALKRLAAILVRPLSIMIFEENKAQKIRHIALGVRHALASRQGKLESKI